MRIFLMRPVGVVVTTRGRERVKSLWPKIGKIWTLDLKSWLKTGES